MRKKYLLLLLIVVLVLIGCERKKLAPPPVPIGPSNLSAEAISANQINLSWKDNATTEKGFYVYRTIVMDYIKVVIIGANSTSYKDTGLTPETTYRYRVSAYNDQGESAKSNEVSATTFSGPPPPPEPLEPPSDLVAIAVSYKQIDLSWRDNSGDEDGFRVRCNIGDTRTKTIAEVGPNTTRYEHSELQPMTHHKYYIEAFRGEENAGSPQVSATTRAAPVEICYSWLTFVPNTRWKISGDIISQADEDCLVEITGHLYKQGGTEPVASGTDKFYMTADSGAKHFEIYIAEGGSSEPKCYPNCDYSVEITHVEIKY